MHEESAEPSYAYRPALMGGGWQFQLGRDALEWSMGRHSGRVPYEAVTRVRLSYRPSSMQSYRFLTEIWPRQGPKLTIASTTWRNIAGQERQDAAYSQFVTELHRRLGTAARPTVFVAGSPPLMYWPGLIIFAAASAALAFLTVRALLVDSWASAAIVAAFLALFLWQVGGFFRRNRPGPYRPDALPAQLLPRA